ncbi:MAG TPA: alpha-L-arabinofuranosidase A, partial [Bryobacteraceae bacterium]
CNIAQIVNVLQSLLLTDAPDGVKCVRTTTYYAFALFKAHRAKTAVKVETSDSASPLDVSVSASRGDNELVVTFINPKNDTDVRIDCALPGVSARSIAASALHHADLNAPNTFDQPDTVTPKTFDARLEGGSVHFDLPRLSIVTARIRIG